MKFLAPRPFQITAGKKAVLLLHSFTGSTIDLRKLGKFLAKNSYSVYAPMYSGHGQAAEELLRYGPAQWWADVQAAYEHLEDEGFEEIAVVGISLGAILALKTAYELSPVGLVTMSIPLARDEVILRKRVVHYAKNHMQYEDKTPLERQQALMDLKAAKMEIIPQFTRFIDEQLANLAEINIPILTMYGEQDDILYKESAHYIINNSSSQRTILRHYKEAGHLLTMSADQDAVNEDILQFLNSLQWKNNR
ncbi:alpha/beta hydrolase [Kurthia sibirica]|uniref:Carboxylesterase n=1 Tax=Kurthia sibirica TaxID=202750 RepID=A0A2U3AKQ9_9BACL|nr:alpha/beta fold hydrolase [Kurthia sibirica]PWI25094.1 carboxylesterase [Kurthia sibirica]GEK34014.1 carboxylesterase [Kurthia sibirica]